MSTYTQQKQLSLEDVWIRLKAFVFAFFHFFSFFFFTRFRAVFGFDWKHLRLHFFIFFFFFFTRFRAVMAIVYTLFMNSSHKVWLAKQFSANSAHRVLFTDPQISFFNNFFIKNESYGTIHTFKNYFIIIFFNFSFQFSVISKRTLSSLHLCVPCSISWLWMGWREMMMVTCTDLLLQLP